MSFVPSWRPEKAPYGFEKDARDLSVMPCPAGYIAKGWLDMNADLKKACEMFDELRARVHPIRARRCNFQDETRPDGVFVRVESLEKLGFIIAHREEP